MPQNLLLSEIDPSEFEFDQAATEESLRKGIGEATRAVLTPLDIISSPAVGAASEMGRERLAFERMREGEERRRLNQMSTGLGPSFPIYSPEELQAVKTGAQAIPAAVYGGMQRLGKGLVGAYADIPGRPMIPTPLGPLPIPAAGTELEPTNIEALMAGEEMPAISQRRLLPPAAQVPLAAAQGLIESAPQFAAMSAMTGLGAPAWLAGGLAFGGTEEGFSPQQAAIGALLPSVGKYSGEIVGKIASQLGIDAGRAMNIFRAAGHAAGPVGYLSAIQASEIVALPPEQRKQAIIDAVASNVGLLAISVPGVVGEATRPVPTPRLPTGRALPIPPGATPEEAATLRQRGMPPQQAAEARAEMAAMREAEIPPGVMTPEELADARAELGAMTQTTEMARRAGMTPAELAAAQAEMSDLVRESELARQTGLTPEQLADARAELQSLTQTKGVPSASEVEKAATVYGDVRAQSREGIREVPVEEGRPGVQPQAPGRLPEAPQGEVLLTPEEIAENNRMLAEMTGEEPTAPAPAAPAADVPGANFVGYPKSHWTLQTIMELGDQKANIVSQAMTALKSLKGKTKLEQGAKPETLKKAIHEIIDLKAAAAEKAKALPKPPEEPPAEPPAPAPEPVKPTPPPEAPPAAAAEKPPTLAEKLESELAKGESTPVAQGVGFQAKSIEDLNSLLEYGRKLKAQGAEIKKQLDAAKDPAEVMRLMKEYAAVQTRRQFPNEAIEAAVKSPNKDYTAPSPLDFTKNPEVADWLKKNANEIWTSENIRKLQLESIDQALKPAEKPPVVESVPEGGKAEAPKAEKLTEIEKAQEAIDEIALDPEATRGKAVKLARKLAKQGLIGEKTLREVERLGKDRDMSAEDILSEISSELNRPKEAAPPPIPKSTWRESFDKETDPSKRNDILRAIADVSKSDQELSDIVDRVQSMLENKNAPDAGNTLWAVASNNASSPTTRGRAIALRDDIFTGKYSRPETPEVETAPAAPETPEVQAGLGLVAETPEIKTLRAEYDKAIAPVRELETQSDVEAVKINTLAIGSDERHDLVAKNNETVKKLTAAREVAAKALAALQDERWKVETAPYRVPGFTTAEGKETITAKDLKSQKSNLMGQISDAIKTAPAEGEAKVTFSVPGDGIFTVRNTKADLKAFQTVAEKHFPTTIKRQAEGGPKTAKARALPKAVAPKSEEVPGMVADFVSDDPYRFVINTAYADGQQIVATDGRSMLRIVTPDAPGSPSKPVRIDAEGKIVPGEGNFPNYTLIWSDNPDLVLGGARTDQLWNIANQVNALWSGREKKDIGTVRLFSNPDGSIGAKSDRVGVGSYEHNVQPGAKSLGDYNNDYIWNAVDVARRLGNEQVDLYMHGIENGPLEMRGKNHATLTMPMNLSGTAGAAGRETSYPSPGAKVHGSLPKALPPLKNPDTEIGNTIRKIPGQPDWRVTLENGVFKFHRWFKPYPSAEGEWNELSNLKADELLKLSAAKRRDAIAASLKGASDMEKASRQLYVELDNNAQALAKERAGIIRENEQRAKESGDPAPGTQMFIGLPFPALKPLLKPLENLRGVVAQRIKNLYPRQQIDQAADSADTRSNNLGREMGNRIRFGKTEDQEVAASAVIAAKFNPANLPNLLAMVAGRDAQAEAGIRYAMAHFGESASLAHMARRVFDWQIHSEQNNGINTIYAENYLPGLYDQDVWMGTQQPFVLGKGRALGTGFKKGKTYETPFHAIPDGFKPQSLRLGDLVEHRVKAGQRLINRKGMADILKGINAVSDGKPIGVDVQTISRGPGKGSFETVPRGYQRREVIPGVGIGIHEDFVKLFDAVTGMRSDIAGFEPGGMPIGELALQVEGGIKHGLLVFDTFHASRIMQKQMFLTRGLPSYKKGYSLLEYSNADLGRLVAAGEITPEIEQWIRANRPRANMLQRAGLNVGRIQEAMYSGFTRAVQEYLAKAARAAGVPKRIAEKIEFNKWVFEKVTRGAMLESGLLEFERVKRANPNWTDEQVAHSVARQLNTYFGNLGRQGFFKSPTMLDASRLVALAPQWVESMARSEILGAYQIARAPIDSAMARRIKVGSLGTGLGQGLLAYMFATQILNLVTRGHLTFQNEEKGHKFDAWIPDFTGKGPGFFVSPMSVVAELTHDMIRYAPDEREEGGAAKIMAALAHIGRNRMSPLARAAKIMVGGRDWDQQKIIGGWNRVKAAAWALAPTPIPLSPIIRGNAPVGQTQRQLTASMGVKTEPVKTATAQISSLARDFMEKSADPKIRHKFELGLKNEFGMSDYVPLRRSLTKGDYRQAWIEYQQLRDMGKKPSDIAQVFRPYSVTASGLIQAKPIAGMSRAETGKFLRTLNKVEQKIWLKSRDEQRAQYQRFQEMLRQAPKPLPEKEQRIRMTT